MRALFLAALFTFSLFADARIFVFHRFNDTRHASASTSTDTLRAEFEYLRTRGYEVVPLSRLADALARGKPVGDNWVVLTVDDGYRSFYDNALPLFKEYGYPFTLFVYVEATEKGYRDFMSWEQIREAAKYGEIGLHGYAHLHETRAGTAALKADTRRGIALFEKAMGFRPKYYAYPYGEYDAEVKKTVASFGFELILNQNSGAVTEKSDPRDLDRIALTGENLLAEKLKIRRLDAEWIAPKRWPERGVLKEIHAKIAPKYKTAELYVTGHGWRRVSAENGDIRLETDLPLERERTRLFLKVGHRQNGIILVKE